MSSVSHMSCAVSGISVSSRSSAILSRLVNISSSWITRERDIVSVSSPRGLNVFNPIADDRKPLLFLSPIEGEDAGADASRKSS
jgi:hypothetical protein